MEIERRPQEFSYAGVHWYFHWHGQTSQTYITEAISNIELADMLYHKTKARQREYHALFVDIDDTTFNLKFMQAK